VAVLLVEVVELAAWKVVTVATATALPRFALLGDPLALQLHGGAVQARRQCGRGHRPGRGWAISPPNASIA
jgi:hypothetical protein